MSDSSTYVATNDRVIPGPAPSSNDNYVFWILSYSIIEVLNSQDSCLTLRTSTIDQCFFHARDTTFEGRNVRKKFLRADSVLSLALAQLCPGVIVL